jgi:hypothetical protein
LVKEKILLISRSFGVERILSFVFVLFSSFTLVFFFSYQIYIWLIIFGGDAGERWSNSSREVVRPCIQSRKEIFFSGGFDGWWLEARGTSIRRRRGWKQQFRPCDK